MAGKDRLSRTDFKELAGRAGVRLSGAYFVLRAVPLPSGSTARFACVVSKHVSSKAALRNLVKRRCREAARPRVRVRAKPAALVFTAKRSAVAASFQEIERDIERLLSRV